METKTSHFGTVELKFTIAYVFDLACPSEVKQRRD